MRNQNFLIRRMKLKALIFAVTAIAMPFFAHAQDAKITLPADRLNARQVFDRIQSQTPYLITAGTENLGELSVRITKSPVAVSEVLAKLFAGSTKTYTMDGNHIIVFDKVGATENSSVSVTALRNLSGTISDDSGTPLEGVFVQVIDLPGKNAVTHANGRFLIENIPSGKQIVKLTSADGAVLRFREITVPASSNADVALTMDGNMMAAATSQTTAAADDEIHTAKATAYYVSDVQDNTVKAFADEPKTQMFFADASQLNSNYLPQAAIKMNLLYLATTSLNLGFEFGLGRKWTFDIAGGLNLWTLNDNHGGIRHWLVQPEFRYWFCQRFEKHFVGLHGIYGEYQIADIDLSPFGNDLTGRRYDGWGVGAGISYGYHLPMGKRWAWEFTLGVGYIYLDYDKYNCGECDNLVGRRQKHYFGPTKAGISLIFMVK